MKTPIKNGFTMVEMMVAMLATAILSLIIGLLLMIPFRTMSGNWEYMRIRRDMANAVKMMAKDIRITAWSDIADSADSYVVDGYLKLDWNINSPVVRKNNVEYQKSGDTLVRMTGGTSETIISEGLMVFKPKATNEVNGVQGIVITMQMLGSKTGSIIDEELFIATRN